MSHKHLNVLRAIYQDPPGSNIHWREVESLLNHLGAEVEPAHGARFRVVLKRMEGFFHQPHHGNACDKQTIRAVREFLGRAGVSPSSYENQKD